MFLRIQLPQGASIECCGVDSKEVDHQPGFIVTKLLNDLMHPVKKCSSLTNDVSLGLRREGGAVYLGGKVVAKMLSCRYPRKYISIQFNWSSGVRAQSGLRGKRKWPLLMVLFSLSLSPPLLSLWALYFSPRKRHF